MGPKKAVSKARIKTNGKGAAQQRAEPSEQHGHVTRKKAVALPIEVEAEAKALLHDLAQQKVLEASEQQPATLSAAAAQRTIKQYISIFDDLVRAGFSQAWIQQALKALPVGEATLDAALDWLCLSVPTSELPRRFAAGGRAGTAGMQVKLIARAVDHEAKDLSPSWEEHGPLSSYGDCSHVSGTSGLEQLPHTDNLPNLQQVQHTAIAASSNVLVPDDKASMTAWILQYAAGSSSDSDGNYSESSSDTELASMLLWADPREVARRKRERAAAKVPPEQRRHQLALEYATAKEVAASAKSAGDRARQKECGDIIRKLKGEMQQLGLSDEEAASIAAAKQAAAAGSRGGGSHDEFIGIVGTDDAEVAASEPVQAMGTVPAASAAASPPTPNGASPGQSYTGRAEHNTVDTGLPDAWDGVAEVEGNLPSAPAAAQLQPQASAPTPRPGTGARTAASGASDTTKGCAEPAQDGEEDWGMGLFEGSIAWEAPAQQAAVKYEEDALAPWGINLADRAKSAAGSKRGGAANGASVAALQDARQPKGLLSQHCHRQGWPQPRYERVPKQGAEDSQLVYSVTLDFGVARGPAKKHGLSGVRTYRLPAGGPSTAGASSIQDAQNGAAVRALWELLGGQQPLHHILVEPYRSMWTRWDREGGSIRLAEADEAQQAKMDFVRSLVEQSPAGSVPAMPPGPPPAATLASQALDAAVGEADDEVMWLEGWRLSEREGSVEELTEPVAAADVPMSPAEARMNSAMRDQLLRWQDSPAGQAMHACRASLPIAAIKQPLLTALEQSDVVVVSGDTGCGKTTQVPQYVLEQATLAGRGARCSIAVTQPRRIAAISVAERVAAERGEPVPGEVGAGSSRGADDASGGGAGRGRGGGGGRGGKAVGYVGYHVRLDAATSRDTRLLFCTTGILLRRLASDRTLRTLTHVVVDEVHERSLQGDFLIALLRDLVTLRRLQGAPLKVILMSATIDAQRFASYFGPGTPALAAAGRTFPVTPLFLEDCYALTGYRLAPDAPAATRYRGTVGLAAYKKQAGGSQADQALLRGGWGDEEADLGPLNSQYDAELYAQYPDFVRTNLSRVNEEVLDYDLLEALVVHVDESCPPGAMLVFLPGLAEIQRLLERLGATRRYAEGRHWLLPLHSSVSPQDQRQAFKRLVQHLAAPMVLLIRSEGREREEAIAVPPAGIRKIVVATDIAETSLTIEDVVYVIDSGKHKERRYDAKRRMSLLVTDWVPRASALQRRGRAGRVRPGTCYSLFTELRCNHVLRKFGAPEITRVPLEELVLQIHLMRLGPAVQFLAKVLEPPAPRAITAALDTLQQVGALTRGAPGSDAGEALTPLGQHLAQLPLDPKLGKLLLLGAFLGCLAPALTIAACMSHRSPFAAPLQRRDEAERARRALAAPGAKTLAAGAQSDHLLMAAAFDLWHTARTSKGERAAAQVAQEHFLHAEALQALSDMRHQFAGMLADVRLVGPPPGAGRRGGSMAWADEAAQPWNRHARQPAVVKAVLCAALAPNVAIMSDASVAHQPPRWLDASAKVPANSGGGTSSSAAAVTLPISAAEEVSLHPTCLAAGVPTSQVVQPFVVYLEKVKTSQVFLRDVTPVSPIALLLFGGSLHVIHEEAVVIVDGWVRVPAAAPTAVLVKQLRSALDGVLAAKISRPERDIGDAASRDSQVLTTIASTLIRDERHKLHMQS